MTRRIAMSLTAIAVVAGFFYFDLAVPRGLSGDTGSASAAERYGKIPLHFEQNVGQADPGVHYLARGRGYSMMLADGRALVALQNDDRSAVLEMSIAGA
ncbi:MAG: hypothetical protein KBD94_08850, partial [Pyrinomonadaceae bacterium]|nr:hypothetical protein [Pyrinomonadaceae bacterium]